MIRRTRAFLYGFRDGWRQPFEVSVSRNVEHLDNGDLSGVTVYDWQDRGINVGQLARAGRKSETWTKRMWPVKGEKNP